MARQFGVDDDELLTVRAPRPAIALVVALAAHALVLYLVSLLPEPQPPPREPIEMSIAPQRPPPSEPPRTAERTAPPTQPSRRKPQTSPVAPELPPSERPPENRAQLPVVEPSPEPAAPPDEPTTFEEQLARLKATRPRPPRTPTGPLAPTLSTLNGVAAADPRLHDEENERRMMADNGVFFRRGLEALRGHWHPDDVLNAHAQEAARRCGNQTRMTFAIAVLDKQGNVVDVDLRAESGCPELDVEALAAFKRVARFPHPPPSIFFLPDGTPTQTARYPVRFIVTFGGGLRLDWG